MYKLSIGVAFGVLLYSNAAMATCATPVLFSNGDTANATVVYNDIKGVTDCLNASIVNFSGGVTMAPTGTDYGLKVTGVANQWTAWFQGSSITGSSFGPQIFAGTNSSDTAFRVYNTSQSNIYFMIRGDGNVGVGTNSPSYLLHVNGSAGKPGGGSWTDSSDQRLKKEISSMDTAMALAKLNQLNPVTFKWINPQVHGFEQSPGGFVAQQVATVFPEFVHTNTCQSADCSLVGGSNSSAFNLALPFKFDAYLVAGLQELSKRVDKLSAVQTASATAADSGAHQVSYQEKPISNVEFINALKELKATNDSQAVKIKQLEAEVTALQYKSRTQTAQR